MQEYRGIKVDDSVKLFKKDGSFNKNVLNSLERLRNKSTLEKHNILGVYIGNKNKIEIDFNCEHKPQLALERFKKQYIEFKGRN